MAVEKDSANALIAFKYKKEALRNNISLRSTYKSKRITDQQGNHIGEPYALSDDERDAFEVCINNIVPDIYDILLKMTSGVSRAFEVDGIDIVLKIQDYKAYNENVLKNVDISINNALVNGALKEWYDICAKPDYFTEYAAKYQVSLNQLRDRLFQLKKKLIE